MDEDEFFIPQLVKHTGGKKVMWSFVFNGRHCVLTTHQLMTQSEFRKTVLEKVHRFPPRRAPVNFESYIGNLMRNCVEQEDAGPV
ncbi:MULTISPECIES: hypothetical protein [unclassified Mesorhizobium]|uniref:hypothetical protein n=1 Tax=unclassified Mesorhizobium TaxID=325217 RepID=UPI000FCCC3C4|nr:MULTISPECIES: hypothetical protein [unclassified Mesorhizobium]RUU60160.1 hypothetical protein EOC99_21835 [Mesorhizobium sp. M7A.T.Ca.TU.009.01.1.1]RUU88447.1 hypothetical protein EOD03_04770 [Mesorhizobium sp. M7A.T.Ca.TU.009.01.1.2]RUT85453.1 hypothetical protein EOD14_17250 [Mesorhizobium sp. M7A.T.Ca.US.000.02.1.1]RUT94662.1 hypothetical protein EOD15_01015 [Mesorhizobium sp. M7A.T.Ca.US.000.02.2.1]RUU03649.1 hypothetical protein EOD12_09520 [Mesorhizobium sp. M7A.T.Ca.TU.009.02.1.1]